MAKTQNETETLGRQPCYNHTYKALIAYVLGFCLHFLLSSSEQPCQGYCYALTQMRLQEANNNDKSPRSLSVSIRAKSRAWALLTWNHYEEVAEKKKMTGPSLTLEARLGYHGKNLAMHQS